MATPLTYDQHIAACRKWGIDVKLWPGSRNACRCHTGSHDAGGPKVRGWGPLHGFMNHITAGSASNVTSYIWNVLVNDRSLLLKSQYTIDAAGNVYLLSAGRCNHAGKISRRALQACIADSWPLSGWADYRGHDIDGNAYVYGCEVIAKTRMNSDQYNALVLLNAAIHDAHGWTGQGSCGHGEASDQRGYADPNLNMGQFRKDVMAMLASGPAGQGTVTKPVSVTSSVAKTIVKEQVQRVGARAAGRGRLISLAAALSNPGKVNQNRKYVQQILTAQGFYNGRIDGVDGPAFEAAVLGYQKAAAKTYPQVKPTGKLDWATWQVLVPWAWWKAVK